ncbi:MAG: hypothetical protein CO117_13315 [Flavobacteriaceae bacterium CG_4_9_14_3_um_filter_33_16]|nr:MAG: hypothetical protein CO117_13315 [Flavobacteriaceae bacterium CG_4_9_14_3_um_filter_33_16]
MFINSICEEIMKILVVVILLVTISFSTPSYALESKVCKEVSSIAISVMEVRQNGVNIQDLTELLDQKTFSKDIEIIIKNIIIVAYKNPIVTGKENKEAVVKEFAEQVFIFCYQL